MARFTVNALSEADAEGLIDGCNSVYEAFAIWTPLDTGIRLTELSHLGPEHLKDGMLSIGKRTVPVTDRTSDLLRTSKNLRAFGFGVRTIQRAVTKASLRVLGRQVSATTLRHTYASKCLYGGLAIEELARRLGIAISTAELYLSTKDSYRPHGTAYEPPSNAEHLPGFLTRADAERIFGLHLWSPTQGPGIPRKGRTLAR